MTTFLKRMGFKVPAVAKAATPPAPGFPLWGIPYWSPALTTIGRCSSPKCGVMAKGQHKIRLIGARDPCHLCGAGLEVWKRCSDCRRWKPLTAYRFMGLKLRPRRHSYCRRCHNIRRKVSFTHKYSTDPAYRAAKLAYKKAHYRRDPQRWRDAEAVRRAANPLPAGMAAGKRSRLVKEA